MYKFKWRGETNPKKWSGLNSLESSVEKGSTEFVMRAGEWLVNDIRKNWSPASPSDPGDPPAKDSGNLDSAIASAMDNGFYRGDGGKFASKGSAKTFTFRFAAAEGANYHGRGEYIQALEKGREGAVERPFVEPALDRLASAFPKLATQYIRGKF